LQVEESNAKHDAQQLSALSLAKVYEKRVRLLVDLDRRVRTIAASGTTAARRLAALSADLPANVWITSIAPDSNGITLDGRARDLTGLSDTLIRLNADVLFGQPSLLSAQVAATTAPSLALQFSLHVAGGGR
jgi:Tfp pilus assembly protein PilN